MGKVIMTATACELNFSPDFWKARCRQQLAYIESIEKRDRTAERKAELQISALEVYRYCRHALKRAEFLIKCVPPGATFGPSDGSLSMELDLGALHNCFTIS